MRTQKIALSGLLACLTLAGLALTGAGCAGTRYERSTGAYLDDQGISARVKTALFRDPEVSGFDVKVDTFRGDVQLSGFVDTEAQKQKAAEIARKVSGVQMVSNNIQVKPPGEAVGTSGSTVQGSSGTYSQPAPTYSQPSQNQPVLAPVRTGNPEQLSPIPPPDRSSDSAFHPSVGSSAAGIGAPGAQDLKIDVSNGRAVISGSVANDVDRLSIERQVRNLPGVQNVENNLRLRSGENR